MIHVLVPINADAESSIIGTATPSAAKTTAPTPTAATPTCPSKKIHQKNISRQKFTRGRLHNRIHSRSRHPLLLIQKFQIQPTFLGGSLDFWKARNLHFWKHNRRPKKNRNRNRKQIQNYKYRK